MRKIRVILGNAVINYWSSRGFDPNFRLQKFQKRLAFMKKKKTNFTQNIGVYFIGNNEGTYMYVQTNT